MATRQYNADTADEKAFQITEAVGGAVGSGIVEVTVDFDATPKPTKREVLRALDVIKARIYESDWDPA